ncbi:MAG: HAD family phosphatase [Candidatus Melainabacteria bacterium]|nr:HAD family phosphatase [Candidatus Melainabacteria bacterium]
MLRQLLSILFGWLRPRPPQENRNSTRGNISAIISDMDGTLLDSEPLHLMAYQQLLARYGIRYTEVENREFLGRTDYAMTQILIERYHLKTTAEDLVQEKETILARLLRKHAVARPGVLKVLQQAKHLGLPVAIGSAATLATIKLVVSTLHLEPYVKTLVSADDVENGKPAPDIFLLAAKRLGVNPKNCLVIEDSQNGVRAAKAAGMHCVAVPCDATRHEDHGKADVILTTLEDLDLAQWV